MDHRKRWNWQQDDWPNFSYEEVSISSQEKHFLTQSGLSFGISKHISDQDRQEITIDLICNEAYKTSEIEGEMLDRDSLQSSIKKHFWLQRRQLQKSSQRIWHSRDDA